MSSCPSFKTLSPRIAIPPITRRNTALPPHAIARRNTTRSNTDNIAHAILIPLITILHARVRALETVVPSRDARKKPVHAN
jgi:hypothetical protein